MATSALREQLQATLGSAYEVERELGGGGMSRVFVATETALGRQVVIKVLPPEMSSALSAERFRREIQLAARLQHPHIVPVLTAGDASGLLFYTMPFVEGESLRAQLARGGELPIASVMRVLRDVAKALAYAHRHGVVHRDVKPENILLSDGDALVADFGVAKALAAAGSVSGAFTSAGIALGTPAYMAPEQVVADPNADHRADLYSLGVVAYEMLSGQPPFSGRPVHAMLAAHATEAAESIAKRRSHVPLALAELVMRCLEKQPADRPQTADEILEAIDWQSTTQPNDTATEASTLGDRRVIMSSPSRHWTAQRIVVMSVAVVALGALVYGGLSLSRGRGTQVTSNAPRTGSPATDRVPPITSIAVLPFVNMSREAEHEYFSDGMTEELIGALSKLPGLRVAARTSSFAFKGKNVPIRRIADELGVRSIVEGSVMREGTRLRVRVQLVDAADGFDRWSERYDRDVSDVFAVQDEIARAITNALRGKLAGTEDSAVVRHPTADLAAYTLYLKGRQALSQRTFAQLVRGSELFGEAIQRDTGFARAYAGLADAYVLMPLYGNLSPREAWPKARAAARNALALDSSLAEAHTALAYGTMVHDWDWSGAERGFRRAIALDPNYATAYQWYSDYLLGRGRFQESLQMMRRAHELDPLSPIISAELGRALFYLGRREEAVAQLRETLQLDPSFAGAHALLGSIYLESGRVTEALTELRKGVDLSERRAANVALLAAAHAAAGNRDSAQALLTELTARSRREYVSPFALVHPYLGLGDTTRALDWLERATDAHDANLAENPSQPSLRPLRSNPRFVRVMKRLGLE